MIALKRVLEATCCVAALMAVPAQAQTDSAAAQDAPVSIGDPVASAKLDADANIDRTSDVARPDEIIVTGTRIVRPNNTSAAPISTTTANDLAIQGAVTIEDALNRLPQVQANAEQNYADSDTGRQRIKLRSLGYERTLMLVDGLRMGLANGADVGIIPTALVDRIDVLSGGASSVYGSDAISGVVNYILKKNFDGVNLKASYVLFNHDNRSNAVTDAAGQAFFPAARGMTNDGGRVNVNLALGKNLLDGRINITGFANYSHSNIVPLAARSYAACEVTQASIDGPLGCSRATFTPNGTIIPRSGSSNGLQLVNNPDGSRTFVRINSGPNTAANPYDGFSFQREFERINTGGFLTAKLSDDIEFYSTALFYRDKSRNPQLNRTLSFGSYGSTPYQVNCDNPFLSASQAQTLCGSLAGTMADVPLDVRYRFDGQPPADQKILNRGFRVTAGLRGRVLDNVWSYDLVGMYARNKTTFTGQPIPDFDRVQRSLRVRNVNGVPTCIDRTDADCVPFDAFKAYNNDTALNQYLFYNAFGSSTGEPSLWQGLATLSADLGRYGVTSPLAKQGVAIAFGGEFRAEKLGNTSDEIARANGASEDVTFTQNVWEVNAEAQAPLIEDQRWTQLLQVNGGYRRSRYNRLRGSFDTWKVEGLWAPIEDITFRGAYNKAQRAPGVVEADQASRVFYQTVGGLNDPCSAQPNQQNPNSTLPPTATIEQCRRTGLPDNLYGSAALRCPDEGCTIRSGGFGLTPETAYTTTFGVVLRPRFLRGLVVSADRFLINLNDSINFFQSTDFINGCLSTGIQYYCRGIVRNPGTFTLSSPITDNATPTTGYIAQGTSNGYKSQSHGWDFQAQYNFGLGGAGALNLSFNGSLVTRVGSQDSPDVPPRNCVGYYGPGCGESLPKWKHGFLTSWVSPDRVASVSVNWRHISPMTISYNADPDTGIPVTAADRRTTYTGVKAYDYIDLSTSFDIAERFTFRLSVNNVFDRDPPLVPNSRSVLGLLRSNTMFNYDLLGRQLVAGINARF
ncbi:TonB-dependent receptor [Sphingomonas sp. KR1UV-12]|uniref:TonB-dependent receptor n=1 Tax=Sphingomonas aurea TaxID=3063994 RepID=A0ABT9EKZ8_9SPHN|nr:TonB-dependent receptor [Sphingomonas sp. KR1UV-12]MDP1027639.1 TonB-dependent receptor [Sphingomonas sp. KR1UV-12]